MAALAAQAIPTVCMTPGGTGVKILVGSRRMWAADLILASHVPPTPRYRAHVQTPTGIVPIMATVIRLVHSALSTQTSCASQEVVAALAYSRAQPALAQAHIGTVRVDSATCLLPCLARLTPNLCASQKAVVTQDPSRRVHIYLW